MKQMEHAWIEGNVEAGTECRACKKEILALDPMAASRCFWCGGAAHNGCKENTLQVDHLSFLFNLFNLLIFYFVIYDFIFV